jgi:dCMP deaminase
MDNDMKFLKVAELIAKLYSGCRKVAVGSIIVKDNTIISYGANRTIPDICNTKRGCLRIEKYGENSKIHRNPEDCRAIHSEIDAICHSRTNVKGSTIYITRYPCESCAKAIIAAGITTVIYGRSQKISKQTEEMFDQYNIESIHIPDYIADDVLL